MSYEQITAERRGRVLLLTLNRPEKLNAWTPQMMSELTTAMTEVATDRSVGAVVITGNGRAFCAGADVGAVFKKNADAGGSSEAATTRGPNWVTFLRNFPKPTIAAVNGAAVGIGVTQILPMDVRIASEEAKFGMFFVRMGLVPELASSALLPQMVGQARALDWCFSGRLIPAQEAREAGMVSEVVAPDQLLNRALELGELYAGQSSFAMANIRKLIVDNTNADNLAEVQKSEGAALARAYASWEHREAIDAFLTKRAADFQKQDPTPLS